MKIKKVEHGSPWTWLSKLEESTNELNGRVSSLIDVVEGMNKVIGGILQKLMELEAEAEKTALKKRAAQKATDKN